MVLVCDDGYPWCEGPALGTLTREDDDDDGNVLKAGAVARLDEEC